MKFFTDIKAVLNEDAIYEASKELIGAIISQHPPELIDSTVRPNGQRGIVAASSTSPLGRIDRRCRAVTVHRRGEGGLNR